MSYGYDAGEYDKGRREDFTFWVKETSRIAGLDENSKILDLGCGTGNYTMEFRQNMASNPICGLDPDLQMISQAKIKDTGKSIYWCIGLGEDLPFTSQSFDCVFASQVWHHIKDRWRAAAECFRVLKEESPLIVRTLSHEQWKRKTVTQLFPEVLSLELGRYPSDKDFEEYFYKAGFSNVEFHRYEIEGYTSPDEFIEVAQKRLWSMFWYLSNEAIGRGVKKLLEFKQANPNKPIRNDELITLVAAWR
jgi:ubiquinone/menaquinone biosynthesis C-methylase UbiE